MLFLAVFPIAIVSNILRIAATLIVTHFTTVEFGTGPFHEWMGLGLFILAFLLMFGLER
ncbi:MAG: archaeosortase/exosortase family protein, partial [candidate division Zixibacteria bacterium]|nr:archaeosortase/exosortase family protein [candidate division Zixibacteria bacterium]